MDKTLEAIGNLIGTVQTLRGPGGCNWDRKQTLESLRPYMLEEAYEVADAVDQGNMEELRKELGDLLLHIIMSSEISRDNGDFDLAEVACRITEKLRRRHPHVFDKATSLTPEEVEKQWEAIKAKEKREQKKSFFDSIPNSMPALQKAWRIQQRASEVGFPWPAEAELTEEIGNVLRSEPDFSEAGALLFSLVSLLRQKGIEPEKALREHNRDFMDKFNYLEKHLHERGFTLSNADEAFMEDAVRSIFHTGDKENTML
ncbi:nucleoside triphosphate pyrophosphohydrolase [Candidatus Fermentibacteria bacterium]|nr:MAG: nucleoside triphosphate pyrophosphohydrolase [Candidatus Fermentibacteria bacterium]